METLTELVNIVSKKRISKIDVLDKTFLNSKNDNHYFILYNAIASQKIRTDEEAAKLLYNSDKKDPRYKMLKSRFKEKLKNTILLLDAEDAFQNNNQTKAYYYSLKNLHIIEVLIKINGTNILVYELIKDDLKNVQKFKFYDILKKYYFHILNYYSLIGGMKSYDLEERKYLKYVDLESKDQRSKYLFFKIFMKLKNKNIVTNQYLATLKAEIIDYKELVFYLEQNESIFLYNYLLLMFYENMGNVTQVLEVCDDMEKLLDDNAEIRNNMRMYLLLNYRLKAKLHLNQFKGGISLLEKNKHIIPIESSNNWFYIKETEFKLYLQDNEIQEAYNVYEQVLTNPFFKRQISELTQKWKIYHAYLVFMDNYLNKGDYKFNMAKFLNDVPVNSKDKSGFNFAIRVIEILFNAARKDYNLIFSKMDALRVYRSRYLNDNTYKRNHLFLSVLLKAEKSGFNNKELVKADWQEITELRNQNKYFIADWEIIPYETLWDIFVELAKK